MRRHDFTHFKRECTKDIFGSSETSPLVAAHLHALLDWIKRILLPLQTESTATICSNSKNSRLTCHFNRSFFVLTVKFGASLPNGGLLGSIVFENALNDDSTQIPILALNNSVLGTIIRRANDRLHQCHSQTSLKRDSNPLMHRCAPGTRFDCSNHGGFFNQQIFDLLIFPSAVRKTHSQEQKIGIQFICFLLRNPFRLLRPNNE